MLSVKRHILIGMSAVYTPCIVQAADPSEVETFYCQDCSKCDKVGHVCATDTGATDRPSCMLTGVQCFRSGGGGIYAILRRHHGRHTGGGDTLRMAHPQGFTPGVRKCDVGVRAGAESGATPNTPTLANLCHPRSVPTN